MSKNVVYYTNPVAVRSERQLCHHRIKVHLFLILTTPYGSVTVGSEPATVPQSATVAPVNVILFAFNIAL